MSLMPITPGMLLEEITELHKNGLPRGSKTGWSNVDKLYRPLPGQVTVITGWPGSGKSEWLDALALNLAKQGWRFVVYSPENMPVTVHVTKLLEKFTGQPFGDGPTERVDLETARESAVELDEWFCLLRPDLDDDKQSFTIDEVLDKAKLWLAIQGYLKGDNRCGLIIDPWNELEHTLLQGQSETLYIGYCLSMVRQWARNNNVHVWIVAHPQKLKRDEGGKLPVPRPDSISGCHSADTEVLTRRGWVKHPDVTLFDSVACFDPVSGLLCYERPTKLWEFEHDGEMHNWRSPSYDALVTPNHRMVVRPNWRRKPSFRARAVLQGNGRPVAYPLDENWGFVESQSVRSDMEAPWCAPLNCDAEDVAILHGMKADAVLKFLGDWIAEGWVNRGAGISLCQAEGPKAEAMRAALVAMCVEFTERVDEPRRATDKARMWRAYLFKSQFTEWVREHCGSGAQSKRIPDLAWSLSTRQKQILFDALMDGDGNRHPRRDTGTYTTTSALLADQVQRLAIELGRMAAVSRADGAEPHHFARYVVVIGRPDREHIALRPTRNLTKTTYTGKVYCLTVPTGAYVVRRNGKPGIYGNSQHWWNKADNCITVWRAFGEGEGEVDIHVQKVRFKHLGQTGVATLRYDRVTGRYSEPTVGIKG